MYRICKYGNQWFVYSYEPEIVEALSVASLRQVTKINIDPNSLRIKGIPLILAHQEI